jgi:ADP-ribosyl-[dinitrogen reductase] hydrolase
MYGAFIGDIEGSIFEFHNTHDRNFDLFDQDLAFTDDSVMTLAVYDVIKRGAIANEHKIADILREWGQAYPYAGYGGYFDTWLYQKDYRANPSYGSGAAMRISPVGFYASSEAEVKAWSRHVTVVSHNHPEAIKGAEVTAMCIYYARQGKSKDFIKNYATKNYSLYPDYESLCLSNHGHGLEICQVSVPQAISAFLLSQNFEDCLRIIISAGGDCDTTGAIACSIADAYYQDIDPKLVGYAKSILLKGGAKIANLLETLEKDLVASPHH